MNQRISWLESKCIANDLVIPEVPTDEDLSKIPKFVKGQVNYDDLLRKKKDKKE